MGLPADRPAGISVPRRTQRQAQRVGETPALQMRGGPIRGPFDCAQGRLGFPEEAKKNGARGGGRTHTTRERQGILSPPRMPFRHPGAVEVNLSYQSAYCNITACVVGCAEASVPVVVSVGLT